MGHYSSQDEAYGAAHARTVASLVDAGATSEQAHRVAAVILNDLQRDGWRWRFEPPPDRIPKGKAAPPPADWRDLRDALHEQLADHNRELAKRDDRLRPPA